MFLAEMGSLLAHSNLAAGIPIGIPMGMPIGMGIGISSGQKKVKDQLKQALQSGAIAVTDAKGQKLNAEMLFELLKQQNGG